MKSDQQNLEEEAKILAKLINDSFLNPYTVQSFFFLEKKKSLQESAGSSNRLL